MFAHAFDRPKLLGRIQWFRKYPVRAYVGMVPAATLLAFAAIAIEDASAHDEGCGRSPVPRAIKLDCCGKADEHLLKPEHIRRGPDGEYIVRFEDYTFVIPADKALPSNDSCSHIFFENVWVIVGDNQMRSPGTPNVYCFITPLAF